MPGHERRQHLEPHVGQRAAQDRPQHVFQRPMNRPVAKHVLAPAQGHGHQRFLARQPALVVEALAAIAHPRHQHPVDPALEHGRRREPEDREVQHQQVGPQQLVQLLLDIRGNGATLDPLALLQGIHQVLGVLALAEVIGTGHRVPAHGVQVADLHLVALGAEGFHGLVTQGSSERLRLGVSVDDQYIHKHSPHTKQVVFQLWLNTAPLSPRRTRPGPPRPTRARCPTACSHQTVPGS
ncbi:hypothetical protein D3C72_754100 [compost metagenome]